MKFRISKPEAKMKIKVNLVFLGGLGGHRGIAIRLSTCIWLQEIWKRISLKVVQYKTSSIHPWDSRIYLNGFQNALNFLYSPLLIVLTIWLNGFQYALMDDGRSIWKSVSRWQSRPTGAHMHSPFYSTTQQLTILVKKHCQRHNGLRVLSL